MSKDIISRLLDELDKAKDSFGSGQDKRTQQILTRLGKQTFRNPESLIRFHELLLFLRAYPQNSRILRAVERQLSSFSARVEMLDERDADTVAFSQPEISGIAATSVTDTFSYNIVRWLLQRHPKQVRFDWDWFEDENRLAETWPRFLPLLEEDAFVEANVPYVEWLRAAKGQNSREVEWLIQRFDSLPFTEKLKAELYDSLNLYISWQPSYRATRSGMKLPVRKVFYHRRPLIQRRDISFLAELQAPSPVLKRVSTTQGEAILNMAREASTIRYRELYGFTHGDRKRVLKCSLGRGVDLFLMGIPPPRRLPLRAYHAAMIFKNGVAVGYFEGLSLFERMESGFNFYYSFREGETAWIYARTLNVFRHLLGVTAFSIDPYQIGYENEEGIKSGAFWFYRKLGFRPTRPKLLQLTLAEERRITARRSYRTSKRVLRQLAKGSMILELEEKTAGHWDRFQLRNIGLAVQRRMAADFSGDAEKIRGESVKAVTRMLGIRIAEWRKAELNALNDLALVLILTSDLDSWTKDEKQALLQIIRSKAATDEAHYLKLMQKHARFRNEIIRLGSKAQGRAN